jgi:predicted transcriptional regulator
VAKYGNFLYGSAKYGSAPRLAYSVEPMSIIIVDFTRALIEWASPTGVFSQIRLVRNQIGFPETSEDGVIIWEEYATEGNVTRSSFVDGEDNPTDIPLSPGKPAYYGMFLFTDQKVWVNAGRISDVIPSDHGMQKTLMDIIPKVYTSKEQSPLGVTDEVSALYKFMSGFSFTLEQLMTLIDLVRPNHTKESSPESLVVIQTDNVGLNQEQSIPLKNQKQLIREAFFMYSNKGLEDGIATYVESLTGYAPVLTVSTNLLLTVQDSTFYNSIGNWTATSATIATSNEQVPNTSSTNQIDHVYTCKVIASGSGSMSLGNADSIKKGVPVKAETEYTASCKLKSPASAGNITLSMIFYDKDGTVTGTTQSSSAVSANNTWKSASKTFTTPEGACYASINVAYSAAGTYYIDEVCIQAGDTVDYDEARAITVQLLPSRTNWIKNPSFEANVTNNWTLDGSATIAQDVDISDIVYSGVKSAKVTATGPWTLTSNIIPITVGRYYTASGLFKSTDDVTVTFIGRDSAGDVVEDTDIFDVGTSVDWSRFTATDLTDATLTDIVTYEIVLSGGTGTFYFDCIQFQEGSAATEYFDGAMPSEYGVVWAGAENNSYSYEYPNKPFKIPRLAYTLSEWTPPNAFWRITTLAGLEYTNLTV